MRHPRRSSLAIGQRVRGRQYSERRRLWLQALEDRSVPAVFTVPTVADTGASGSTVTLTGELRWAIATANDELNFPGPDVINITGTGTMTLTKGEMAITTPMTINGPGANLFTIDAGKTSRIFNINDSLNGNAMPVTLAKMALTNGSATDGGAIFLRDEDLTITDCSVSNSKATSTGGGIYFFENGKLTMRNCTVSGNSATGDGGGIYTYGYPQILIENSTISGNTSGGRGGGLAAIGWVAPGTFTMRFSTVTGNSSASTSATGGGGGFRFYPLYSPPAITVESSIVSGNTNPGGSAPDIRADVASISNSAIGSSSGFTFDNKGGNLAFGTDIKLGPLANNGGPTLTHLPNAGSPLRNNGGPAGLLTTDQRGLPRPVETGTDIGSVESPYDPSPVSAVVAVPNIVTPGSTPNSVTITYSDLESKISIASIDVTDIEIIAPDGLTKLPITGVTTNKVADDTPVNATYTFTIPGGSWSTSNLGAYTVNVLPGKVFDTDTPTPNGNKASTGTIRNVIPQVFTVDIAIDENDGNFAPGDLSLREALVLANKNPGSADTINFDPVVFATQKTIVLTLGQLPVTDVVTISGSASRVVLNANLASRVLNVNLPGTGATVTLNNLVIQNGKITGETGADPNERGGGIFVDDDNLTLNNCLVQNNTSQGTGGGIYLRATPGVLTINDSVVTGNSATGTAAGFRIGSGGGISVDNQGVLNISRSTVAGNTATTQGGGIYFVVSGSMNMSGCTISGNIANGPQGGGGFYFYGTVTNQLIISNSTLSGNKATVGSGGGIALNTFNGTSQLQIRNSTIAFNEASFGGGISRAKGSSTIPLSISSSIIAKNIISTANGIDISLDNASDVPGNNNFIGILGSGDNVLLTGANNIVGDPFTPQDPMLDPVLANNGGPTLTHKLLTGSTAIDAGIANALTTDQRGGAAIRVFNDPGVVNGPGSDGTDMGAFELQPVVAPTVTKVEFNGGALQRSMVTTATVTFSEAVTFPNGILSAFQLNRYANGSTGLVNLNAVQTGNTVTLTFIGGGAVGVDPGGSLQDGTYQLTIVASKVQGGLAVQATDTTSKTHRLFGDADGSGSVTASDFNAFRLEYGSVGNSIFDFDGNGSVTASDFNQFRTRYGLSGYQP